MLFYYKLHVLGVGKNSTAKLKIFLQIDGSTSDSPCNVWKIFLQPEIINRLERDALSRKEIMNCIPVCFRKLNKLQSPRQTGSLMQPPIVRRQIFVFLRNFCVNKEKCTSKCVDEALKFV